MFLVQKQFMKDSTEAVKNLSAWETFLNPADQTKINQLKGLQL